MRFHKLSLRQSATADIEKAYKYLVEQAGGKVAARFILDVDSVLQQLADFPALGNLRLGQLLDVPGLRSLVIVKQHYHVLYFVRETQVDVIRILHEREDIPALLRDGL